LTGFNSRVKLMAQLRCVMDRINIASETLVSLAGVTAVAGGAVSYRTAWRWATTGLRGVRLATVFFGGHRFTSKEAVARFVSELTEARNEVTEEIERLPASRRSHAAAMRWLAARGIC
jgi:hypothetical protein